MTLKIMSALPLRKTWPSGQSREGGPGRGEEECGSEEREERSPREKLPKAARCPGTPSLLGATRVPGEEMASTVRKVVRGSTYTGVTLHT